MAIISFRDRKTREFFESGIPPAHASWISVKKNALRKLDMLNYAKELKDLRAPPGNMLEALKGDLLGFYSIRINDQWRIIFRWTDEGPADVEILDYHF